MLFSLSIISTLNSPGKEYLNYKVINIEKQSDFLRLYITPQGQRSLKNVVHLGSVEEIT